jgi:glutaredoxin 3
VAKQLLDEKKIEHQYIDITTNPEALKEMVDKTGSLAVPVIDIDGEVSVGFDKKWMLQKLELPE